MLYCSPPPTRRTPAHAAPLKRSHVNYLYSAPSRQPSSQGRCSFCISQVLSILSTSDLRTIPTHKRYGFIRERVQFRAPWASHVTRESTCGFIILRYTFDAVVSSVATPHMHLPLHSSSIPTALGTMLFSHGHLGMACYLHAAVRGAKRHALMRREELTRGGGTQLRRNCKHWIKMEDVVAHTYHSNTNCGSTFSLLLRSPSPSHRDCSKV